MEKANYSRPSTSVCELAQELAPVNAVELAFALSFFVAAATRKLGSPIHLGARQSGCTPAECEAMLAEVLFDRAPAEPTKLLVQQTTLELAFSTLWKQYEGHRSRRSLCARVLCFHLLMECTEGRAVEAWTVPCTEDPERVLLSPAVVDGLACVRLVLAEGLVEAHLVSAIEKAQQSRSLMK